MEYVSDYQTDLSGILSLYKDTIEEFKNFYELKCLLLKKHGKYFRVNEEIKKLYKGNFKNFAGWIDLDTEDYFLSNESKLNISFHLNVDENLRIF